MLKAIIVDDESKSRESLQILLHDFVEGVEVKSLCQDISEAMQAIERDKPDIVFLDIQLQRETGFDLLTKVKDINFEVIFTTAYSEYAIKAFRFSAIDYLLKPIDIEELKKAVGKVEKRVNGNITSRLTELVQNLRVGTTENYKLALPTLEGLIFIRTNDILYCEASSNYTQIYTGDGKKYLVSKTLKEYEDLLSDHNFFRIHNSYLINLNAIKKYVKGEGGYVILSNDVSLDVSKRKKEAFLSKIGVRNA
ncbi:LytR/AlgR family response regulator transcription factor [Chryseolinea lacunae]|uniref:Response regulator transcription factor n=1 Tax=Chryseolinea lacunae TaxID=2801331 RepID=A0ABS1KYM5_9BACT|nr:LytTR family DNA-binding domain-containing protein [Chryseolinea lacunae]MBL0744550.1 response regulator transcription factor [Chryseolinea lacunae]